MIVLTGLTPPIETARPPDPSCSVIFRRILRQVVRGLPAVARTDKCAQGSVIAVASSFSRMANASPTSMHTGNYPRLQAQRTAVQKLQEICQACPSPVTTSPFAFLAFLAFLAIRAIALAPDPHCTNPQPNPRCSLVTPTTVYNSVTLPVIGI